MELCMSCFNAPEQTPGSGVCSGCYKKTTGKELTDQEMTAKVLDVKEVDEKGMPKFESFEEMQAWLKKTKNSKTAEAANKVGTKKAKGRSPSEAPANESATQLQQKEIYSEVHVFVREGDSWTQVLKDAREDRRFRNANVLIFAHDHIRGEACSSSCREVV